MIWILIYQRIGLKKGKGRKVARKRVEKIIPQIDKSTIKH